jgi:hypothetical protein
MATANGQIILDVLPAEGSISYQELQANLAEARKSGALAEFHKARRSGVIESRVIGGVLHVARPGQLPARGSEAE